MTPLARAGWLASAAFFTVLLASIFRLDYVGLFPQLFLVAVAIAAALRPPLALSIVALLAPVIGLLASARWNNAVQWPEALACAALAGLSLDAARVPRRLDRALAAPALVFMVVVLASIVASTGVIALRLGPSFTSALVTHVTREHFTDVRGFPAIFTGLRLLEGVLLFALAARLSLEGPALRRLIAAAAGGATLAAAMNIARLVQVASRNDDFWASVIDLTQRLRWNVHYGDFNAAGSYFVMALLFAIGLAIAARRAERVLWLACGVTIASALWLTSSRVAFLAGALALGAVLARRYLGGQRPEAGGRRTEAGGRTYVVRALAVAAAAIVLLAVVAIALPQRGNQKSSILAADVRLGMAQTGARMIASRPIFGIGLGEFYQRSGEFSSPELLAKFPVAVHENAHNNFIQITAELGLTGGLAFTWLVIAGLVAVAKVAGTSGASHLGCQPPPAPARVAGTLGASHLFAAGLGAFVLTAIGGHPLLVAEPAFVFWTAFGAVAGAGTIASSTVRARWWTGALCLAILVTLPWRMQAMLRDADLEHVGIGVSSVFQTAPDGTRYREAEGHATLFVPWGAFRLSVNPRTAAPVRLELRLDGRVANVVTLAPNTWNDVSIPGRTERASAKYARLDLRVLDDDGTAIWVTKVQPVQ